MRRYTFPCQKFALFVSPFTLPISPFLNGHHCGAEICNEFSLSVAKKIRLLCSDSLNSSGAIVLPIDKMDQINNKNYWNVRLRSEDKHHPRKSADRKAQIRKAFVSLTILICALRSADFLGWCLSPERNLMITYNLFFYFQYGNSFCY